MERWGVFLWCGLMAVMGIVGLFVAAESSGEPVPYWGGIGFFVFSVLFVFHQVKRTFDRAER